MVAGRSQLKTYYKDTHRNKSQNYFFGCSLSWVLLILLVGSDSSNVNLNEINESLSAIQFKIP
jgi:hypothetical protein